MLPTHNDVHVDGLLTNLLIGFSNPDAIYDQILPIVNTYGVESGKYGIFDQDDQFRNTAEVIPPGGNYPVDGYRVSSDTWSTEEIGQATELPDRTLNNATGAYKKALKLTKARFCADRVELKREVDTAAGVFTTGVWATDDTTATDWDDYVNSNPILDVSNASYTIEAAVGKTPNVFVIGNQSWKDLRNNTSMLDFLGATERGLINIKDVKQAFDVPKVLVGKTILNSSNEGQDASYGNIWGQNALLLYVEGAPTPDPYSASAGYIFQSEARKIWGWRFPDRKTQFFAASVMQDHKITCTSMGYFFSAITT